MKKYIIGAIFGFVLAFTISAQAEEIKTVIGKAIQGEFSVKIDGSKLDKKAIVVDGSSYLPVRAFGEAVGYDVKFDPEGEVLLTKINTIDESKQTAITTPATEASESEVEQIEQPSLELINWYLKSKNTVLQALKGEKDYYNSIVDKTDDEKQMMKTVSDNYDKLVKEIAALEAQKAELEQ